MSRLPIALALPLLAAACSPYAYEANCMNLHVSPNYGQVREIPGGFEVTGSGVTYTAIEVSQTGAALRPGTAGQPADDYPKPSMRSFECKPL